MFYKKLIYEFTFNSFDEIMIIKMSESMNLLNIKFEIDNVVKMIDKDNDKIFNFNNGFVSEISRANGIDLSNTSSFIKSLLKKNVQPYNSSIGKANEFISILNYLNSNGLYIDTSKFNIKQNNLIKFIDFDGEIRHSIGKLLLHFNYPTDKSYEEFSKDIITISKNLSPENVKAFLGLKWNIRDKICRKYDLCHMTSFNNEELNFMRSVYDIIGLDFRFTFVFEKDPFYNYIKDNDIRNTF
jgi:hypothetical protein